MQIWEDTSLIMCLNMNVAFNVLHCKACCLSMSLGLNWAVKFLIACHFFALCLSFLLCIVGTVIPWQESPRGNGSGDFVHSPGTVL